jgi:hypothetical protein
VPLEERRFNKPHARNSIGSQIILSLFETRKVADHHCFSGMTRKQSLSGFRLCREDLSRQLWSEAIAVGSLNFVGTVKSELAFKRAHRNLMVKLGQKIVYGGRQNR